MQIGDVEGVERVPGCIEPSTSTVTSFITLPSASVTEASTERAKGIVFKASKLSLTDFRPTSSISRFRSLIS